MFILIEICANLILQCTDCTQQQQADWAMGGLSSRPGNPSNLTPYTIIPNYTFTFLSSAKK